MRTKVMDWESTSALLRRSAAVPEIVTKSIKRWNTRPANTWYAFFAFIHGTKSYACDVAWHRTAVSLTLYCMSRNISFSFSCLTTMYVLDPSNTGLWDFAWQVFPLCMCYSSQSILFLSKYGLLVACAFSHMLWHCWSLHTCVAPD